MNYRLYPTTIIHWDNEGMFNVDTEKDKIYSVISAEIYKVYNNSLPIIIEGQIRIKNQLDVDVFSSIFHTKALLTFSPNENPINDLMEMLKEIESKEKEQWNSRILATPLQVLDIDKAESDLNVKLNKACQIRDIAKERKLLA